MVKPTSKILRSKGGFTVTEMIVVVGIVAILSAVAIPQMVSQRRLMRTSAVMREIAAQMRYVRQQAMSQRQAFTFQYDDVNKRIVVIDHNMSGTAVLTDANYPNNTGSVVVRTTSLTQGGLPSSEITCAIPTGLPTTAQSALPDGVSKTPLSSNVVNITFQPDGTVIDANGNPVDKAIFMHNNRVANSTASAISVLGAAGRVKIWRYDSNANKFAE